MFFIWFSALTAALSRATRNEAFPGELTVFWRDAEGSAMLLWKGDECERKAAEIGYLQQPWMRSQGLHPGGSAAIGDRTVQTVWASDHDADAVAAVRAAQQNCFRWAWEGLSRVRYDSGADGGGQTDAQGTRK